MVHILIGYRVRFVVSTSRGNNLAVPPTAARGSGDMLLLAGPGGARLPNILMRFLADSDVSDNGFEYIFHLPFSLPTTPPAAESP